MIPNGYVSFLSLSSAPTASFGRVRLRGSTRTVSPLLNGHKNFISFNTDEPHPIRPSRPTKCALSLRRTRARAARSTACSTSRPPLVRGALRRCEMRTCTVSFSQTYIPHRANIPSAWLDYHLPTSSCDTIHVRYLTGALHRAHRIRQLSTPRWSTSHRAHRVIRPLGAGFEPCLVLADADELERRARMDPQPHTSRRC